MQERRSIADNQLLELPKFLSDWGVSAVILSGGEPLLHPRITDLLEALHGAGLQVGLKTNGLLLQKDPIRKAVLETCSWVGVSLDAATDATYTRLKKCLVGTFEQVISGVGALIKERKKKYPKVTTKFLLHHTNYGELYAFVQMSKALGANDVHIRPVTLDNYHYVPGVRKTIAFYLREARKDLEDDTFKVYGVVQKFNSEWTRIIRFKRCVMTALSGVFASDGQFYLCPDRRGDKNVSLGKFYPFEELKQKWGSAQHRNMVKKIAPQFCTRCGSGLYNEVVEHVENDTMFLDFI